MESTLRFVALRPVVVRRSVWALALLPVAAAWCWGGSSAASSTDGLSFVPRVGGPHATFVARFVAPFPVGPRGHTAYFVNVVGPCEADFGFSNFGHVSLKPGDTAAVFVTAPNPDAGWCPGRYVGSITHEPFSPGRPEPVRTLFSRFTFRVLSRDRLRRLAARPDVVKLLPRVGALRETFVLRFTASFRTGGRSHYAFRGRGPGPCRRILGSPLVDELVRGDRVVIGLDPGSIGNGRRREWCPGRYFGAVDYVRSNRDGDVVIRRRVARRIRFTVSP